MLNKELVKKAHEMAREIKGEYPEVNYQIQFGLCVSYLLSEEKGEYNKMVELKGTEKQVKYAEDLKEVANQICAKLTAKFENIEIPEEKQQMVKDFINYVKGANETYQTLENAGDVISIGTNLSYNKGYVQNGHINILSTTGLGYVDFISVLDARGLFVKNDMFQKVLEKLR